MPLPQCFTPSGSIRSADIFFSSTTQAALTREGLADSCVRLRQDAPFPSGAQPAQSEGLLHDARNLLGALSIYCDLLSRPGVLKPEHLHYADDLRLVSTRSGALLERLLDQATGRAEDTPLCAFPGPGPKPIALRRVVERCSGLLTGVAGGTAVAIRYGEAADVPVRIAEESLERILVNLVRNAAAAVTTRELSCSTVRAWPDVPARPAHIAALSRARAACAAELPAPICISVGVLTNRVGDPRPWPFRRVRLTVEDAGCGMTSVQLERLQCGNRAPARGSHGIGFRVVQELVASSNGDLRVLSTPGQGTCVQIELPVAAPSAGTKQAVRNRPLARIFAADQTMQQKRESGC